MTVHILDDWSDGQYEASEYLKDNGFTPHAVQDEPCVLFEKNIKNEVLVQVYLYKFAVNVEIHSLDGTTYSPQVYVHRDSVKLALDEAIDKYNSQAKPFSHILPQIDRKTITAVEERNDELRDSTKTQDAQ